MARIVFLDIDGVMIPSTMFLVDPMCSAHRIFPPTTIAVMNKLCERTGAKVVINSTHSNNWPGAPDIEKALERFGFRSESFHEDSRTVYPIAPRRQAIVQWLDDHPDVGVEDYIAFDDARFNDPNLILVDPDAGLHIGHLNEALYRFGEKPMHILV